MEKTQLKFTTRPNRTDPSIWEVIASPTDDPRDDFCALFSGPKAHERALDYEVTVRSAILRHEPLAAVFGF